jgi:hypothetical protein
MPLLSCLSFISFIEHYNISCSDCLFNHPIRGQGAYQAKTPVFTPKPPGMNIAKNKSSIALISAAVTCKIDPRGRKSVAIMASTNRAMTTFLVIVILMAGIIRMVITAIIIEPQLFSIHLHLLGKS